MTAHSAASIEALAGAINEFMGARTATEADAAKATCRQYKELIRDQDAFSDALEYARVLREADRQT